jgi:1,4-alpha-glucan branching enzyme
MGALLHPDRTATTFRVWAPFATSVSVAGDFNGWSATAHL